MRASGGWGRTWSVFRMGSMRDIDWLTRLRYDAATTVLGGELIVKRVSKPALREYVSKSI